MNKVLSRYAIWDGWEFPKSCSTCKVFSSANDYLKKVPDGMQAKIVKSVVKFLNGGCSQTTFTVMGRGGGL